LSNLLRSTKWQIEHIIQFFWQQRISATTYMKIRKFYDGLGRLVQSQAAGAALDVGTRDIVVNSWYDAYGNLVEQSVPYAVTTGSGYRTPDLGQASTLTGYDVLGRPRLVTATDGSFPATYTYLDGAHRHAVTHLNGVQKYRYDTVFANGNPGNMTRRVVGPAPTI
jgi:hypothetical protein